MGTSSFVLVGLPGSMERSFGSACHGAGRRMSRTGARKRIGGAELRRELERQGIVVRCASNRGLAEEAPFAYKDVDRVVASSSARPGKARRPAATAGRREGVVTFELHARRACDRALLGDVMLGRGRRGKACVKAPGGALVAATARALRVARPRRLHLECCISTRGEPTRRIPGKPFFFRGPPSAVDGLAALGVRAAGLANNHALDFEEDALADTLALLGAAGIATAGGGRGREAARAGVVVSAGDLTVGFVAFHRPSGGVRRGHDELGHRIRTVAPRHSGMAPR